MKKSLFVLAALIAAFCFCGCESEPKEISPQQSIDSAAIVDTGFVTAQDGTQKIFAKFSIKKTDNLKNKELTIKTVRNGLTELAKEYKFTSSSGFIYVTGAEVPENPAFNMGETTVFTFSYDDTYSKSVTVPFEVPAVKNAGFTSDSEKIYVTWDNSHFAEYTDFIESVRLSVDTIDDDDSPVRVIDNLNCGFETLCTITDVVSTKPYTISLYTMSKDVRASEIITLGPIYPGVTPDYSGEQLIWELKNNGSDETVSIHNGANKTFYIVETNSSNIKYETNLHTSGFVPTGAISRSAIGSGRGVSVDDDIATVIDANLPEAELPEGTVFVDSSALANDGPDCSSAVVDYKIGDSKDIYYVTGKTSSGGDKPEQKKAYLKVQTAHCNGWIVEGFEGKGELQVTANKVKEFCDIFEQSYELERNIFGAESDQLIYYDGTGTTLKDLTEISPTGTKINIVFADLYGDGAQSSLVLGYFWCVDYQSWIAHGNKGKYIFMDTYGVNKYYNQSITTVAHEYQHMINYSVKTIRSYRDAIAGERANIISAPTWYNEMSSMLAEDMLQQKLNAPDSGAPMGRFYNFNSTYMDNGISNWKKSDVYPDYARSYAFGAYLARKYGGAAFVKDYMANTEVGFDSLLMAVQKRDPSVTKDILLRDFAIACINDNEDCTQLASYLRDADQTITYNGYSYPMKGISPWRYYQDSTYTEIGPYYCDGIKGDSREVANEGIKISKIGHSTKNNIKLTVQGSTGTKTGLKAYIVAVPD